MQSNLSIYLLSPNFEYSLQPFPAMKLKRNLPMFFSSTCMDFCFVFAFISLFHLFFYSFITEVQLIYTVVLITAVQQRHSFIYIHIFFFYILFCYGLLQDIEYSYLNYTYSRTLFLHSIYKSLHLLTSTSHSIPPPFILMYNLFRLLQEFILVYSTRQVSNFIFSQNCYPVVSAPFTIKFIFPMVI